MHAQSTERKRRFNRSLIPAIAIILIALTGTARAEKVYLGQSSPGLSSLPVEIGIKRGFYKNEGFDDVLPVSMRSNLLTPALMTGDLDFTLSAGTIINAAAAGLPVKIVMSWLDRPYHMLVARPGINNITDLKGKKIAVSSFGSTPTWLVLQALAKYAYRKKPSYSWRSAAPTSALRHWRQGRLTPRQWTSRLFQPGRGRV